MGKLFEKAFTTDTNWRDDRLAFIFRQQSLGKISIQNHQLAAGHAGELHNFQPLTTYFPNGTFNVELSLASDDPRYSMLDTVFFPAYVRIVFSNKPVKEWKFALTKKAKLIPMDSVRHNYCDYEWTDTISFIADPVALKSMNAASKKKLLQQAGSKFRYDGPHVVKEGKLFFIYTDICFRYQVYAGYDSTGKLCCLLFDLGQIQVPPSFFSRNTK